MEKVKSFIKKWCKMAKIVQLWRKRKNQYILLEEVYKIAEFSNVSVENTLNGYILLKKIENC